MRNLIIIILSILLGLTVNANTYYVSTTGSDVAAGTFAAPWATPQKAFNEADAGDTVFFRGGVYYPTIGLEIIPPSVGNTGTEGNPICYFNYPGESPIFDFRNTYPDGNYVTGVFIQSANFLRFKGIEICNVYQRVQDVQAIGLYFVDCNNIYCENVKVHHISGNAIRNLNYFDEINVGYDSTYYINCDAYDNCDTLRINPVNDGDEGNSGDGWKMFTEPDGYLHFEGCRAYRNSDDGFDPTGSYLLVIKNCWSFSNGYLTGDGNGAKIGGNGAATDTTFVPDSTKINAIITNNIFADNHGELGGSGIQIVEQGYYLTNSRIYNNTLYDNDAGFSHSYNSSYDYSLAQYFNNICYSSGAQYSCAYTAPDEQGTNTFIGVAEYPSWIINPSFTVTNADFQSLDVSELEGTRQSDGSLPTINFMRLAEDSDLIDAGTNVGLSYNGTAPDLGAIESGDTTHDPSTPAVVSGTRFILHNGVIVKI